jgi:sarcosine oxidase subunit delta
MLHIPCPWCGPRDEPEFRWGGEVPRVRPGPPETVSDAAWAEYLFMRDNLKDFVRERWQHELGCRQWFIVERSTVTHEIRSTAKLDLPPKPWRRGVDER